MNHIMIDIEALGSRPTSAIASIAAAKFEPLTGVVGQTLYMPIDSESSEAIGGTLDASTFKWWLKQSTEARAELVSDRCLSIGTALEELNVFIQSVSPDGNARIWARGTDYDLPIIYNAMRGAGVIPAWHFWNVRDVRTIDEIALLICGFASKRIVSENKHHALADVLNQIAQLSENLHAIATTGNQRVSEAAL